MRRRHTLRSRRDHPRSRGENFVIEIVSMRTPGSSPLMRGKHGHVSNWQNPHGLIPTHAGKTLARAARSRQRGAHPRSHGENQPRVRRHTPPPGSSPLTRGKPQDVWIERLQERLIPTHAGKTWSATERSPSRTAHPRSRGENLVLRLHENHGRGSSPLTRGELACDTQGVDVVGLIPTHAGKTAPSQCKTCARRAHPRSRGENQAAFTALRKVSGSSPRMRGKRARAPARSSRAGLIPTHAGKT